MTAAVAMFAAVVLTLAAIAVLNVRADLARLRHAVARAERGGA